MDTTPSPDPVRAERQCGCLQRGEIKPVRSAIYVEANRIPAGIDIHVDAIDDFPGLHAGLLDELYVETVGLGVVVELHGDLPKLRSKNARGKDLSKLRALLESLIRQEPLAARHRDHPLRGIWKRHREAHIEPDWLLIFSIKGDELHLVRTGTHSDLFRN